MSTNGMSKPHKWVNEIKAWADGEEVEVYCISGWQLWTTVSDAYCPDWNNPDWEFRIKPKKKPPTTTYTQAALAIILMKGDNGLVDVANAAIERYIAEKEGN